MASFTIRWGANLAYAVGLITTDGCLSKDGRHFDLTSKDLEQIHNFKKILKLKNKIGTKYRGPDHSKKYNRIQFGDVRFYKWLVRIGLMSNKSRRLGILNIPSKYFADFLRGCIDGDGNISAVKHPESKYLQLRVRLASGSPKFLAWMRDCIRNLIKTKGGYIENKSSVQYLCFGKTDSIKILEFVYYNGVKYYLKRKLDYYHNLMGWASGETENTIGLGPIAARFGGSTPLSPT